jgi:hypothetical protein
MRQFSARMFPDSVTVAAVVESQDAAGGRVKSWPSSVSLSASVQLGDPRRWGAYQGSTLAVIDGLALFPTDPLVKVDDQLVWQVTSTYSRKFTILGPSTPEAGRNALYTVPLKEVR